MKDQVRIIKRSTVADLSRRGIPNRRKELLDKKATLTKELRKVERELVNA